MFEHKLAVAPMMDWTAFHHIDLKKLRYSQRQC